VIEQYLRFIPSSVQFASFRHHVKKTVRSIPTLKTL